MSTQIMTKLTRKTWHTQICHHITNEASGNNAQFQLLKLHIKKSMYITQFYMNSSFIITILSIIL